jgi:hypothetical protein
MSGSFSRVEHARKELAEARRGMHKALQRPQPPGGRLGPGNVYRQAVFKLMKYLTQAAFVGTVPGKGAGIGPEKLVLAIETPSATKYLTGLRTTSKMTTLFRQVEFGTGTDGVDPVGNVGSLHEYSGGWVYGKDEHRGLHLEGAKPARVLWQEAQVPYSEDYRRLTGYLESALTKSLT